MQMKKIRDLIIGPDTNVETKNKWIKKQLDEIPKGSKILDAGAGEQFWKPYCDHLIYVSQDFCQYNGKSNDIGLQSREWKYHQIDIVSDITDIPVADNSFDAVLCTEVLEHVPNPNAALKELIRVIKRGGRLILTAPFCSLTHMAPYHFCSGFNIYWFENALNENGARIIASKRNGNYYEWLRQEIIRLPFVVSKYQNKKSALLKLRCALFANTLKKYINSQNNSGELLCFEYMICAVKK